MPMPPPDPDDFDTILAQLRAAEANDAPDDQLQSLRRRLTAAADREAQARQSQRDAEDLAARGPGFLKGDGTPEPCALLLPAPDCTLDALPIGASRLGGLPDLPPHLPWPTHDGKKLPFLAQLDLTELPPGHSSLLPSDGWLYAFGVSYHADDNRTDPAVVLHHRGPRAQLTRAPRPDDADIWPPFDDSDPIHDLVPLALHPAGDAKPFGDDARDCAGWLLGEVDDFWGTAGTLAYDAHQSGDDWINLLAISSVGSMQWSDCGHLYLLARRADLATHDFTRVLPLVCSS